MTKAEMIEKIAKDADISKAAAAQGVRFIPWLNKRRPENTRQQGNARRLWNFQKVYRKTRKGRNPQTGEQIKIKGRNAVTFKASKNLV
jgi:DNA-binding protein HU-beta